MTFSQRMGFVEVRDAIQVDSLDKATRNALWNLISPFLQKSVCVERVTVYKDFWTQLYQEASDTIPSGFRGRFEYNIEDDEIYYRYIRSKVIDGSFGECLDVVEYIITSPSRHEWVTMSENCYTRSEIYHVPTVRDFNAILKENMVGYRFVDGLLARITDECEIIAIENASAEAGASVREQLSLALQFLTDRKSPNYAKSVQCSISAVEAQCNLILGGKSKSLGDALKELGKKGVSLHSALKGAFDKLYGFTSNADGIRHAGVNPSDVDQSLAKFMLVTCSAFVNYLIEASR